MKANVNIEKDYAGIINKFKERFSLKVHLVKPNDEWCKANGEDAYMNSSTCCMGEVWIGIYDKDDSDLLIFSFFHEIGHLINVKEFDSTKEYELDAWNTAIDILSTENIPLNNKMFIYMLDSLKTYTEGDYCDGSRA